MDDIPDIISLAVWPRLDKIRLILIITVVCGLVVGVRLLPTPCWGMVVDRLMDGWIHLVEGLSLA